MSNWAVAEMASAVVPCSRVLPNLALICSCVAEHSGVSFSAATGHAGRQAASRLFGNPETKVSGLLAGHGECTAKRCAGHDLVLAAQDTTVLDYSGHTATEGLGPIHREGKLGLLAHSSLIMTPSGCPLGVGHLEVWARRAEERGGSAERRKRPTEKKESNKWIVGLHDIEKTLSDHLNAGNRLIVTQDREADIFDFITAPRHEGTDLLIRAAHPRMVEVTGRDGRFDLFTAVANADVIGEFVVEIPRKGTSPARSATLELRIQEVTLIAPRNGVKHKEQQSETVAVVDARERPKNEGGPAISWTLLTTLQVNDASSAAKIVEYYTRRWQIERLHYILKSGLKIERLQFDDSHSLSNALAIHWVVAWRILHMTHVAREEPNAPVCNVLDTDEIAVLEEIEANPVTTSRDAVTAIAKLAGYRPTKNGAPPGVKSLWIGLRKLEAMVEFYQVIKHRIS